MLLDVVVDGDAFHEQFVVAKANMDRHLDEKERAECTELFSVYMRMSDEQRFLSAISQNQRAMKAAGQDRSKVLAAYLGLSLRRVYGN